MPHFQIPNARVGQPYQAQIRLQYPDVQDIIVHGDSIQVPVHLGIEFNEKTQQLQGMPTQAGDFRIYFQYKTRQDDTEWLSAELVFIIIADPSSLWQINEPDPEQPYQKPHTATAYSMTENFRIAACSQRGRSHQHTGAFREDDFFIRHIPDSDWAVLIVADGAGSARFSREGSRLAVQSAGKLLSDYIEQYQSGLDQALAEWQTDATDHATTLLVEPLRKQFQHVFYQAAEAAVDRIEQEASLHNLAVKDFATTLLAAVIKQQGDTTFITTFWIGDGAIAVYAEDSVHLMGRPDGGEFAGQTRFLVRQILQQLSAQVNIGYYQGIKAVILMTDGISDPCFETDAGLANVQKWHNLWSEIQPHFMESQPEQALLAWSGFLSKGHHDDRTLAILWTMPSPLS